LFNHMDAVLESMLFVAAVNSAEHSGVLGNRGAAKEDAWMKICAKKPMISFNERWVSKGENLCCRCGSHK